MSIDALLNQIVLALPAVLIGVGVLGVVLLVRCWIADTARARRFAATVRQLREAQAEEPGPVVIQNTLPVAIGQSRLGAHLGACIQKGERAAVLLDEENLGDASHELGRLLHHLRGIQTEYVAASERAGQRQLAGRA